MILDVFYSYLRPILCSPLYSVLIGLNSRILPASIRQPLVILASLEHQQNTGILTGRKAFSSPALYLHGIAMGRMSLRQVTAPQVAHSTQHFPSRFGFPSPIPFQDWQKISHCFQPRLLLVSIVTTLSYKTVLQQFPKLRVLFLARTLN